MFSRPNFLQKPQYREIEYKANLLYAKSQYENSEVIDDSAADVSINPPADLKTLQDFISKFTDQFEFFPDFFKNLNSNFKLVINTKNNVSIKLIITSLIAKIWKCIKLFLLKLNLDIVNIINSLNIDEKVNLSKIDFANLFEFNLSFGNYFDNIFSRSIEKSDSFPFANDAINFKLTISSEDDPNITEYLVPMVKQDLFIHNYVSYSVSIAPGLLGSSYKFNFPIYQSLSANLFNNFNSQNAYIFKEANVAPSIYTLSQDQALTNCFWFNFKNALEPEKATGFKLWDTVMFFGSEGAISDRGIVTNFNFELFNGKKKIKNTLSVKAGFEVDNVGVLDKKENKKPEYGYLLDLSFDIPKKVWTHVCLLQYLIKPENIVLDSPDSSSKNRFIYELFINDQKTTLSIDILSIGRILQTMYPKIYNQNPFETSKQLTSLKGERSLTDFSFNALFSDIKLFKFEASITTRKDSQGSLISLPDEAILTNAFYSAKFLKFAKFADDLLLIGSSIDSTVIYKSFMKQFGLMPPPNPQNVTEQATLGNYKFQDIYNPPDSKIVQNFNSIFQLGFPKVSLLNNDFILIEVMFDADFIIKTFQKAALETTTQNNSTIKELDYNDNYVELKIFDFERKSQFKKNLDFYDLQHKQKAFFAKSNINSENKPFYHYVITLEIKNSFDLNLNSTIKNRFFEFKVFVNYFNLEKQNTSFFINSGISDFSNYDRYYILPKTVVYPFTAEAAVKKDCASFIQSAFLDVNIIEQNYFFYKYYSIPNIISSFFYNLKFNQALDFQNSKNYIYQPALIPWTYNQISINDSYINFDLKYKPLSNSTLKNKLTLYSIFKFYYNENYEMQMLKPSFNYFESFYEAIITKNKIQNLNLKIPFKNEEIEVLASKNYLNAGVDCVLFTINLRENFKFAKQFNVDCYEPNLLIRIFYIKTYKKTATYCIMVKRNNVDDLVKVPNEYIQVFSLATRVELDTKAANGDSSNHFFHLKFQEYDDLFFDKNIINGNNVNTVPAFRPQSLYFNIIIQRVTAEVLLYDFPSNPAKSCVAHLKSNLYPLAFKEENLEANLLKQTVKDKVNGFTQLEPNLLTFSVSDSENLSSDLDQNIFATQLPDYEDSGLGYFNNYPNGFGKLRLSIIKSCLADRVISLIKTDYRDIYFKNTPNADIVFSIFESKGTFIFNKFCYKSYTAMFYTTEDLNGTISEKIVINSHIVAIDILKFRNITFEFVTETQDSKKNIIIKVSKKKIKI